MQDDFEAPLTGTVRVDINVATAISEFLLMFLKMPEAPLTGGQINQFSEFREVVKAGPEQVSRYKDKTTVLRDGIVVGSGPKCLFDRHIALKYLRAMIYGEMSTELQQKLQVALLDAVASKGPKKNQGINGKFCQGQFGYTNAQEAADYLSGRATTIVVHRASSRDREFKTYFAEKPNELLRPDKLEWNEAQKIAREAGAEPPMLTFKPLKSLKQE